ncbi:MAG: VacJ family lipoprotein [Halieaceae bacterium]|nr:VacJ family lipoprotein [Halieaceae bacterium]MCP4468036.1 VacJ family lipoprotein [Halieaceae bacterium]MCP4840124.1 VacJ family lipoprotein [Halieaceae bacterium]MDG2411356.1 VacJ family lipoprotein [Halioglobus sp.]
MMLQRVRRTVIAALILTLAACASYPPQKPASDYPEPIFPAKRILPPGHDDQMSVYDPWEGMNKHIYNFNYHFDKAIFLPVVQGYETVVPDFARTGIHNFFKNFDDMLSAVNSLLQLAPTKAAQSTGRVLVNSTVGLFGLLDVASLWGIPRPMEDFGQTMGRWGVGQGPYLVLPFLGPSNLRDGIGKLPDFYVRSMIQDEVLSDDVRIASTVAWPVDTRANTSFRYYETGSAFEYRMVRWLYSTKRRLDVEQ